MKSEELFGEWRGVHKPYNGGNGDNDDNNQVCLLFTTRMFADVRESTTLGVDLLSLCWFAVWRMNT